MCIEQQADTPGYERRSYLTSANPDGMFAVMAPPKRLALAKSDAMTLGSDFPDGQD